MANLETLSRPYAQALFEHSGGWSEDLDQITQVVSMPGVSNLIDSPHLSYQEKVEKFLLLLEGCLLYTSPSPRDRTRSRMPSSA